jgi:hypothetical protein
MQCSRPSTLALAILYTKHDWLPKHFVAGESEGCTGFFVEKVARANDVLMKTKKLPCC